MPFWIALDNSMKNFFNTYKCFKKICVVFALYLLPSLQYFLHPSKEIAFCHCNQFAREGKTFG